MILFNEKNVQCAWGIGKGEMHVILPYYANKNLLKTKIIITMFTCVCISFVKSRYKDGDEGKVVLIQLEAINLHMKKDPEKSQDNQSQ